MSHRYVIILTVGLATLLCGSVSARADSWNRIGESCSKASGRNYLESRTLEALQRIYRQDGIPRPSSRTPGSEDCVDCAAGTSDLIPKVPQVTDELLFGALGGYIDSRLKNDIQCIDVAQKHFLPTLKSSDPKNPRKPFTDCVSKNSFRQYDFAHSPCATPAQLELLARSFRKTLTCTGQKASEVFPLMAHESGFHPLVRSPTNAAGIGQLTSIALLDVRQADEALFAFSPSTSAVREINETIERKKECSLFKDAKIPKNFTPTHKCELMVFPKTPFLNFLASLKYFAMRKAAVTVMVESNPILRKRYSKKDLEKIILEGTYYNYNAGGWVPSQLVAYIASKPKSQALEGILEGFPKYLMNKNVPMPKHIRRDEIAGYVRGDGGVGKMSAILNKKRGRECFAN